MKYFGQNCNENQNTYFMFSKFIFKNRVVYEIVWKNILQQGRPQMAI